MTTMIYGASGYTGALVARAAVAGGAVPILAGRAAERVRPLADELGCPVRAFDLGDPAAVAAGLDGVDAVLNAAGPFERTAAPLAAGCLAARTHYLDLAGETAAVAAVAARQAEALAAGVTLLPAAGFGVVATDLAAAAAAEAVPAVRDLRISFRTVGGASRGTAEVLLLHLHEPGVRVVDGAEVPARAGESTVRVDFGDGRARPAVLNPWRADLVTAPRSTGAASVTTYQVLPAALTALLRGGPAAQRLLASAAWQRLVGALVRRLPTGPSAAQRAKGCVQVHAVATGGDGSTATALLTGPEAYDFTASSAAQLLAEVGRGDAPAGFHTPVTAFTTALAGRLPGVQLQVRSEARHRS